MSGYENSPDYGGRDPSWFKLVVVAVVIVAIAGGLALLKAHALTSLPASKADARAADSFEN